jgi:gp178|nr:MAG TPA: Protein of unknown function (DUF1642) [Caudoviricetes sp.]
MNKKELFEAVIELPVDYSGSRPKIDKLTTLELIKLLDEPEKVTIPQFVADWYENNKDYLEYNFQDWLKHLSEYRLSENEQFGKWVNEPENNPAETLIKMKLFGYEKEKRYLVRIIGITNYNSYLNYHKGEDKWTIESRVEIDAIRTEHTRKELEDAGFGEVFNSTLFEVEEVEE